MAEGLLRARPLESNYFGFPIQSADVNSVALAREACAAASAIINGLVILRVPGESLDAAQVIESAGGRLCDVLLTLGRTVPHGGLESEVPPRFQLRMGEAKDALAIADVSRAAFASYGGHWHADSRVPSALSDELYVRWATDLAAGVSDSSPIVVASDSRSEKIVGFLALRAATPVSWEVPLTAVHPNSRGNGLLRGMLMRATTTIARNGAVEFRYETQVANAAALLVVGSCGFVPVSSRLTFHLWADSQTAKG